MTSSNIAQPGDLSCIEMIKGSWTPFLDNLAITLGAPLLATLLASIIGSLIAVPICVGLVCLGLGGAAVKGITPQMLSDPNAIPALVQLLLPLVAVCVVVALVAFLVPYMLLFVGWTKMLLGVASGESPRFSELFYGGRWFWNFVGASLLIFIATIIGSLFFVIPGIFVSIRSCMALFLVVQTNCGPIEAIKQSNELVKGYSWQILIGLVLFNAAVMGMNLLSAFLPLLSLLIFPMIGFYQLVLARIYLMRSGYHFQGVHAAAPHVVSRTGSTVDNTRRQAAPSGADFGGGNSSGTAAAKIRDWDSKPGGEMLGAVFVMGVLLILGVGAALFYGLSLGHRVPAAQTQSTANSPAAASVPASASSAATASAPADAASSPPEVAKDEASDMLSDRLPFPDTELAEQFVRFHAPNPLGQSTFGFEVAAPKDWQNTEVKADSKALNKIYKQPVELGELGCGTPNTSEEIWCIKEPPAQTNLEQFCDEYCRSMGFSILKKNSKPNRMECIIKYRPKALKPMRARLTFVRVGDSIIWLACCAPDAEFDHLSNIFCVAAASFSPVGYSPLAHPDLAARTITGSVSPQ